MTVKFTNVSQKLISRGGFCLWLPSPCIEGLENYDAPDVYTQDSVQKYPLGSRLEYADGRLFRYGQFGETQTASPIARLLFNANLAPGATGGGTYGYEGSLDATSDYAVGSTTLVLNDTTDRAENYYEDGMLSTFPSGHYVEYRILGNEVATSVDDVTIYIDPGLKTAHVVNSTGVTAYPSIFRSMQDAPAAGYQSAVGACLCTTCTSTYYGWVQRRGRAIITPTAYFGDSANERLAMVWQDGTIATAATADPSSGYQILGYLTQRTQSGYGDLEVQLMLE